MVSDTKTVALMDIRVWSLSVEADTMCICSVCGIPVKILCHDISHF